MLSALSKEEIIIFVTFDLSAENAFNLVRSKILSCGNGLIYYHTMPHFGALKMYSCGKYFEKRRNCLKQAIFPFLTMLQAISPFLTMFCTQYGTYFSSQMHFKMSSAICFNLDQSKILSFGNRSKVDMTKSASFSAECN